MMKGKKRQHSAIGHMPSVQPQANSHLPQSQEKHHKKLHPNFKHGRNFISEGYSESETETDSDSDAIPNTNNFESSESFESDTDENSDDNQISHETGNAKFSYIHTIICWSKW